MTLPFLSVPASDTMPFKNTEADMLRLTEKDLDDFADYMKSGEMEQDFRDGCEHDRLFLLSLLEKFIDVADLADETATKLIFRGNLAALAGARPEKKD